MAQPLLAVTNQNQTKRLQSDRYVEGYATTFDSPYLMYEWDGIQYFEVIDRNALVDADLSDVIMQYDHTGKVFARQSNNTLGVVPDAHGLFVYADLSRSRAAIDLHEEISAGLITKMSWAFKGTEDSYNEDTHPNDSQNQKGVRRVGSQLPGKCWN